VTLTLTLIVMMSWTVFWIDPVNAGTQAEAVESTVRILALAERPMKIQEVILRPIEGRQAPIVIHFFLASP